jgi:hypothetical protein
LYGISRGHFKRDLIEATFDQLTKSQHEVLGEPAPQAKKIKSPPHINAPAFVIHLPLG